MMGFYAPLLAIIGLIVFVGEMAVRGVAGAKEFDIVADALRERIDDIFDAGWEYIAPRPLEPWTPAEREALGIADNEAWIANTDKILNGRTS